MLHVLIKVYFTSLFYGTPHVVVIRKKEMHNSSSYWHFNYNARGQTGFFSRAISSLTLFPSVFTSHSASNSQVPEVSKIFLTFFMMSET